MTLAAIFIVRNEIDRIAGALFEIRPYVDEIVVVDQSSDDGTSEKAREYAGTVLTDEPRGTSEPSRGMAVNAVRSDWIINLDADEMVTNAIGPRLRELTEANCDGYFLRRQTVKWHPGVGTLNSEDTHHFRMWRKGTAAWGNWLHEGFYPANTARAVTIPETAILHLKTLAEQEADNERYWALGQPR